MAGDVERIEVWMFSDSSLNIVAGRDYGQSGILTGLKINANEGESVLHLVEWSSSKQRRVRHCSYGSEILASSDDDDRGYYIQQAINVITNGTGMKHILHVDSRGLLHTISSLHDGKKYIFRPTVQIIRDSFERGDINTLRRITNGINIADTLTKRHPETHSKFNDTCANGQIAIDANNMRLLHSEECK